MLCSLKIVELFASVLMSKEKFFVYLKSSLARSRSSRCSISKANICILFTFDCLLVPPFNDQNRCKYSQQKKITITAFLFSSFRSKINNSVRQDFDI